MTNNTIFAASVLALAFAAGCSSEDGPTRPENTGERAEALTGEVEQARQAPSGEVESTNIEALLTAYGEIDYTIGDAGMPCDLDPFDFEAAGDCSIEGDGDSLDVSCMSSGAASGTSAVDVHLSGGNTYVHYWFDNVCAADRDLCVTGEGAVKVSATGDVIVAGELVRTRDGQTDEIKYGVTVTPLSLEVVLWHNGDSYVVNTTADGVDLAGANGSVDCDIAGSLDAFGGELSGSCTGAADVEL